MRTAEVSANPREHFDERGRPTKEFGFLLRAIGALLARTGGAKFTALGPLPSYTVATLPDAAANARCLIYVSNESGGAQPAFSDGTNWRRLTDRAVVS